MVGENQLTSDSMAIFTKNQQTDRIGIIQFSIYNK